MVNTQTVTVLFKQPCRQVLNSSQNITDLTLVAAMTPASVQQFISDFIPHLPLTPLNVAPDAKMKPITLKNGTRRRQNGVTPDINVRQHHVCTETRKTVAILSNSGSSSNAEINPYSKQ